jgi:AAA15 family ATPase/GTPase
MRIKEISLKNFKRFTDLTIKDIPESAKLVLLIGANGSGKSSVFDAFNRISKAQYIKEDYYHKVSEKSNSSISIKFTDDSNILTEERTGKNWSYTPKYKQSYKRLFYGRSSIRIIPKISKGRSENVIENNLDTPDSLIEQDLRFNEDVTGYLRRINEPLREKLFKGKGVDNSQLLKEFINPLNESLAYIFSKENKISIALIGLIDATVQDPPNLVFKKGNSEIAYDYLSHGEKQVIILLLNFIVRNKYYQDTIYFIDEMDTHLETSIQKRLIEDVVKNWIPEGSQLWTASHALGFIEYANKSDNAVILDFDNIDFDVPQVITPSRKNALEVYEIAIPKEQITSILGSHYKLVVVENNDAVHLNAALGANGYLFLPANNNREVFLTVKADSDKLGLRDRDYLKPSEMEAIKAKIPNLNILTFYTFENYIYHPDNIAELRLSGFDKAAYISEIIRQKQIKLIAIVAEIGTSRSHYIEFKEGIVNDGIITEITDALQSDDLDTFYPYFNMKNHFSKEYLNKLNYTTTQLAQTKWFKTKLKALLT